MSLARLGARVVGLDFSEVAIDAARSLAKAAEVDAEFVIADVYDAAQAIGRTVDLVYTSAGTINWLGDLDRWAAAIVGLLEVGGSFYIRDMHPALWTFAEILNALIGAGMVITRLEEHLGLEWPHGPSAVQEGTLHYLPGELRYQVPQMFSLWAERRSS